MQIMPVPSKTPWTDTVDQIDAAIDALQRGKQLLTAERRLQADLLRRSADKLQSYCESANGDLNDPLAMEIYKLLGD